MERHDLLAGDPRDGLRGPPDRPRIARGGRIEEGVEPLVGEPARLRQLLLEIGEPDVPQPLDLPHREGRRPQHLGQHPKGGLELLFEHRESRVTPLPIGPDAGHGPELLEPLDQPHPFISFDPLGQRRGGQHRQPLGSRRIGRRPGIHIRHRRDDREPRHRDDEHLHAVRQGGAMHRREVIGTRRPWLRPRRESRHRRAHAAPAAAATTAAARGT